MKKKITFSIDDELLMQARIVAAKKRKSLSSLLREFLDHMVKHENDREVAKRRLNEWMREGLYTVDEKSWTREELYDRR